jgi:drug/metabolite transporter (DMT)-like permease
MWIIYSVGASIFWGLTYILCERLYGKISLFTVLAIGSWVGALFYSGLAISTGSIKADLPILPSISWLLLLEIAASILATLCIAYSVSAKNAVLAGLIEISYPLFIALFGYLLFRQSNLNPTIGFGAALIFAGIVVVCFGSQNTDFLRIFHRGN